MSTFETKINIGTKGTSRPMLFWNHVFYFLFALTPPSTARQADKLSYSPRVENVEDK